MRRTDWKRFTDFMKDVWEVYQKPPLSERGMRLYFDALAELPFEMVVQGVERHMKAMTGESGRFAPKPADILLALFGTPEQQAAAAWVEVQKARSGIGTGRSVRFDDPRIHAALLACGGWVGLAWATNDKWPCFRQAYIAATTNDVSWEDVPNHMAGGDELDGGWSWMPDQIVDVKTQKFELLPQKQAPLELASGE